MDNIIRIIKYNNMSKTKIKSLYDQLLPEVKLDLKVSARQYSTAKLLKYTLMSKSIWTELSMSDINDLIAYTSLTSYKMSPYDFMYGENIIKK
jgi:hypothetical protein|tara:strand:- start:154 stop:432 length:279 start_codon:yes stop_codon:yes gene_type:complete